MYRVLVESVIVGLVILVVGKILSKLVWKYRGVNLPDMCQKWDDNYTQEISLFLTGFLLHLGSELVGLNKWYCQHGHACMA